MKYLTVLLSLGLGVGLSAGEPFVGTNLTSYLTRALSENPELRSFEHRYGAAKNRIPQLSSLPDPTLQLTYFVESVQTRTGPQENVLILNQRIPWFGKLKNREVAASAETEALWFAYQNQQLMLVREVGTAFYEYGYLEHAIRLTRENLDLLKSLEPVVETRVKAGGNLNSLLRLKVEIGKMDDQLQSLTQKRLILSARLSAFLALPESNLLPWPEWTSPDPLPLDSDSLREDLLSDNPSLQMYKRKTASAEARRAIAKLESYPDVVLGVNYVQIGDPEINPNTADAGEDAWGVTAAISLPLWRNKNKAVREEAQENLEASQQETLQQKNRLLAELESSLSMLQDAERRLSLYGEELLDLAKQSVDNNFRAYEVGQAGILEVIDSQRSLLEMQLRYKRAAADAWQQRIRIQTLVNRPLTGETK